MATVTRAAIPKVSSWLKPVRNEQARAKVGAFGSQGSGKTTTLSLLAVGLSKTYHDGAPVAFMDTENGSDYLKPIFDAEGINLLVHKSGAFADMKKVLQEAEEVGCCAFIMDSVTHTWRELVESYCRKKAQKLGWATYAPQFQDWKDIKAEWAIWTTAYLNSQLHCLVAGRAGYEYEYQASADNPNKKELVKGDTKMKAEGEFGYEPSLLIEMVAERSGTTEGHGGQFNHVAYILKDRARSLNGKHFQFPDINEYKAGDWKKVFNAFEPHFRFLDLSATQKAIGNETSEELFDNSNGDTPGHQARQSKTIALEEIENLMGIVLWPGSTNEVKKIKLAVLQKLFGVRSWEAVKTMSLQKVEVALFSLHEFEKANQDAKTTTDEEVLALLGECIAKVMKPEYRPNREPGE